MTQLLAIGVLFVDVKVPSHSEISLVFVALIFPVSARF